MSGDDLKPLADAARDFPAPLPEENSIGLLYAPNACHLAVYRDAEFRGVQVHHEPDFLPGHRCEKDKCVVGEEKLDIAGVYEARIFNSQAELRWLRCDASGNGRTAVVEARPGDSSVSGADCAQPDSGEPGAMGTPDPLRPIPQCYLIWGKVIKPKPGEPARPTLTGWTEFGSPRVGPFWVPVDLTGNDEYARFTALEYLKVHDDLDGNVAICDERLTGIEPYSPPLSGVNKYE